MVQNKKNKGQIFALKTMIKREIVYQKQQYNVMNERLLLEKCNYPFILRIEATYQDSMKLYMLLELVQVCVCLYIYVTRISTSMCVFVYICY